MYEFGPSVPAEEITGIDLVADVVQAGVITVGDDGSGFPLEGTEIVDDLASKEGRTVFEGGLIDDYGGTFCLDAFHDPLD